MSTERFQILGIAGSLRRASYNRGLLRATEQIVPDVLKNAIDWASRPPRDSVLHHKPVALVGASPGGFGTVRSQLALRQVFLFTKSLVLPEPELYVSAAAEKFDQDGNLQDEETRRRIGALLEAL